jgi:hypothetical protein
MRVVLASVGQCAGPGRTRAGPLCCWWLLVSKPRRRRQFRMAGFRCRVAFRWPAKTVEIRCWVRVSDRRYRRTGPRYGRVGDRVWGDASRVDYRSLPHAGRITELWALLPAEGASALAARLDQLAARAKGLDERSADQRRADALVGLALGTETSDGGGLRPAVNVTVALSTPSPQARGWLAGETTARRQHPMDRPHRPRLHPTTRRTPDRHHQPRLQSATGPTGRRPAVLSDAAPSTEPQPTVSHQAKAEGELTDPVMRVVR